MASTIPAGEFEVCDDCMFAHANGEVSDDRPADEPEVWALWADEPAGPVTMGGEHADDCDALENDGNCECHITTFSHSRCGGCGSQLAGTRHTFTYWTPVPLQTATPAAATDRTASRTR